MKDKQISEDVKQDVNNSLNNSKEEEQLVDFNNYDKDTSPIDKSIEIDLDPDPDVVNLAVYM